MVKAMNKNLQLINLALPIGSLEAYIARINQMPLLTENEEKTLAHRFWENQDLEAARKLVLAHMRFVVRVARGYMGYGLPLGDLIQEGNVGLMKAVKKFDPSLGVRLVSFAVHWIKAEIHEFILRNWRIVKVATTKAQRKLFFNLRRATKQLAWFNDHEAKIIAQELNVTPEDVRVMEKRMNAHDESFDGYGWENEDSDHTSWSPAQYLEDQRYNPALQCEHQNWSDIREQRLQHALKTLDDRSRHILQQRWLIEEKATLHDLAAKYGISAERVRQIEKNAMDKIKVMLSDIPIAFEETDKAAMIESMEYAQNM